MKIRKIDKKQKLTIIDNNRHNNPSTIKKQ